MLAIGVLGLNFKTADLNLREAIARGTQSLGQNIFLRFPVVLLSTCNRTEVYFTAENLASAHSDLLALLRKNIEEPFEHRLYSYFGIDCFAHLCRVTAGLDSAMFAETEIQGQVKQAYLRASARLPACLHFAFQKALKVGKSIRSQLSQENPTLYGTLWRMTDWKNKKILLVGYSEFNRGFASYLMHKNIRNFTFCTKNPEQVEGACNRSVLERWQEYDVIVCASKAEGYLIRGKGESHHLIFDLSVPRNVDPQVGESVTLYNIDQFSEQNREEERYEALLWENVVRLWRIYAAKTQHFQVQDLFAIK